MRKKSILPLLNFIVSTATLLIILHEVLSISLTKKVVEDDFEEDDFEYDFQIGLRD